MLDMIGDGTIAENEEVILELINTTTELNTLIDFIYPDLRTKGHADTISTAILSLRNAVVDYINSVICSYLPSNYIDLFSHNSLIDDSDTDLQNLGISEEFLNTISKPNTPPHTLRLKEGMHCYLLRNLSPDDGLLSDTKIKIQKITRQLITAELISVATAKPTTGLKETLFKNANSISGNRHSKMVSYILELAELRLATPVWLYVYREISQTMVIHEQ
ncbi:hypothetical protein RvY_02889 [Ramazzottius varieornatus]|uniref:DNA helicase Pif1-like 2B domain-containing protein n=1 Tax=Ramazzottius varieornatus TaxID=947166 RepID=A0A1D1UM16_RAMVA|nr:hypothetical protein RvY_02889 [Ramazzottius varieornatus]